MGERLLAMQAAVSHAGRVARRRAREYKRRGLPLACIVIDFFHWTRHGEWRFDPKEWPDPKAMLRKLDALGVKTMVSIWPTVSASSIHYKEMREKGYLLRTCLLYTSDAADE